MHLRRVGVASLALSSLALLVGGCGGSEEDAASDSSSLTAAPAGVILTDSAKYRSPGTVTVTVADSDLDVDHAINENAHVTVVNVVTGQSLNSVKLVETDVNTGIFVGTFDLSLVSAKGKLTAADKDTIRISYHDGDDGTGQSVYVTKDVTVDNTSANVSVSSVSVDPASLKAGETLSITYTVANDAIGAASTGSSVLVMVQDQNHRDLTGWWRYSPSVAPGATWTDTIAFTVPGGWNGSYYVKATAYTSSDLTPTNDSLTSAAFAVTGPDVAVESVTFDPASLKAGETLNITYALRNSASAGLSAGSSVLVMIQDQNHRDLTGWWRYSPAIAPDAQWSDSIAFKVPGGWNGSYYVKATAYTTGDGNAANDSLTSSSFAVAGPDVAVESVTFDPASLKAGETLNITYALRNSASAGLSAGSSVLVMIQDQNHRDLTGWWRYSPAMAPDAQWSDSIAFKVPGGWNGTYYVKATAYTTGDGNAANDSLTSSSFAVAGPDVAVESVTFDPASLKAGETLNITYALRNAALAGASAGSSVLVMIQDQNHRDLTGWWRYSPAMAPDAQWSDSIAFTVPSGWSGTYYVKATAYTTGDGNAANDSLTSSTFSVAGPDVGVESVSFTPLSLTAGETLDITYTLRNSPSAGSSAGSSVLVMVQDENHRDLTGWWRYSPAMAPGDPWTDSIAFAVPAGWNGNYYVKVTAYTTGDGDPTNDSAMSYEPFSVAGPDVALESVTFDPPSLRAGETLNITYALRNAALAGASAGSSVLVMVQDAYHRDLTGWWRYSPAMAPDAQWIDAIAFTVPSGWNGNYFVKATAYTTGDVNAANDSLTSEVPFSVVP